MTKLKGGVRIINAKEDPSLNTLAGDIVSFERGLYNVKLRGTTDTVVRLPKTNLVKMDDAAESIRTSLLKAVESQPFASHLQQRLETMKLEDEFSYLVIRHTNPIGFDPLPESVSTQALVRFMEVYYLGKGRISTRGRQLTSFYLALTPFYTHFGQGTISPLNVGTTGDIFTWCQQHFEQSGHLDPLLVVKAFAYVQHRLDFGSQNDDLLDAFCVSMYIIHFLQRHHNNDGPIQKFFLDYGSKEASLNIHKVLWCFCRVYLNLAIHARDKLDERRYNLLFPDPYGTTISEQVKVTQWIVDLRPDCAASHLAAFASYIDTKDFVVLSEIRDPYMEAAYYRAVSGKEVADRVGDPLYQYLFHMIVASWMPTSTCKTPCTVGHVRESMRRANQYRDECEPYVPSCYFFQGKQYENSCKAALRAFPAT